VTNSQRIAITVILCLAIVVGSAWASILFADTAEPMMTLEVRLDGVTIFKTAFPLCHEQRGTIVEEPQKTLSFFFKPGRAILWMVQKGVTVTPMQTKPNQLIEGSISIWHADAGSSGPTIGASFYSDDRILMRAIHITHPKKRDCSEIATGLLIVTYPEKRKN
jgi:hypothetical protein